MKKALTIGAFVAMMAAGAAFGQPAADGRTNGITYFSTGTAAFDDGGMAATAAAGNHQEGTSAGGYRGDGKESFNGITFFEAPRPVGPTSAAADFPGNGITRF